MGAALILTGLGSTIITSRNPGDLPAFVDAIQAALA